MSNQHKSLARKYLDSKSALPASNEGDQPAVLSAELSDVSHLRPGFIAVGVYFCSSAGQLGQFGNFECGIVDPITDGAGRTWRLLSTEYLIWMAGMISNAFESDRVNDSDLGVAILKFYRVRDRLEREIAAAEGCPAGGLQEPGGAGAAVAGGSCREPGDESEADDAELAAMVAA